MKKLLTAKSLSLLMLLSLLGGKAEAGRQYDDESCETRDCGSCFSSCYECGCNPLYCGAWDLQIQGGVNPIVWRKRDDILAVNCSGGAPFVAEFERTPKFSKLFRVPWIVGGQVGYAWSDNARLYVEFNYSQANGKHNSSGALASGSGSNLVNGVSPITFSLRKYKLFDAYVGARYYWDRWCDRVAFFLGAKVGLTSHRKNHGDFTIPLVSAPNAVFTDQELFRHNTVVSGGANFGFDVCFCGNWSFVVTGEVVASCGPRGAGNVVTTATGLAVTNLVFGHVETELRFPVTAAVRYSF